MKPSHILVLVLTVTMGALWYTTILKPGSSEDIAASANAPLRADGRVSLDEGPPGEPQSEGATERLSTGAAAFAAVAGASEIPYPIYPSGSKYRVGGENGLKIVVFSTSDDFSDVDQYYRAVSDAMSMPRLLASRDYVRYASDEEDRDPFATHKPGIVIHEFADDEERVALGASPEARTNIIMSF